MGASRTFGSYFGGGSGGHSSNQEIFEFLILRMFHCTEARRRIRWSS